MKRLATTTVSILLLALSMVLVYPIRPADAVVVGGEVFLQGKYVEVGIHRAGSFGTSGNAPNGFHSKLGPTLGGPLGFVCDMQKDGWASGTPPQSGDYFLPGTPEEGWTVEWNGAAERAFHNYGRMGLNQVPTTSLTESSSGTTRSAVWEGTASASASEKLKVTKTIHYNENDQFFVISTVLTNAGTDTLNSVEFMRNVDPDQEQPITGNFTTSNYVVPPGAANPNMRLVVGKGLNHGITLGLGTIDSRARVSTEGFSNRDPDAIYDSPVTPSPSSPIVADQAIALAYRFGSLAPGQSVSFDYAYILNESDLVNALGNLGAVSILQPSGTVSGNSVIFQATTTNLAATAQMQFYVNGLLIGVDTTPDAGGVFETTFDSTLYGNGTINLRVVAAFTNGAAVEKTSTAAVDNSGPPVSFAAPVPGQVFNGSGIPIQINVLDPAHPPTRVSFFRETAGAGSVSLGQDTSAPFGSSFSVAGLPEGETVIIKAVAFDSLSRSTTIQVSGVTYTNSPPVAQSQSVTTNEDTPKAIMLAAADGEGAALTYTVVSGPTNGMLSGAGAARTYTPNAHFSGVDSFTFKANDGSLDSGVATVSITVTPVNDAPAAADDSYSVIGDLRLTVAAPGLLANDADVDSHALAAVVVAGPSHGSLSLNPDGSFVYTPAAGYVGADSFTYTAGDGALASTPATVSINVTAPVCVSPLSGMVAWLPGQDSAEDIAAGNDGTLREGATFATGRVGKAFSFDGVDDYVSLTRTAALEPQQVSLDAWVYSKGPGTTGVDAQGPVVVSKDTTNPNPGVSYAILGPGTTGRFSAYVHLTDGTQPQVDSANTFALNQWHHVAMTWDGSVLSLYVNGAPEGSVAVGPKTIAYSDSELSVGRHSIWPGRTFYGLIDEAKVFDRTLSAAEVETLYDSSSAGFCNTAPVAHDQSVAASEDAPAAITLGASDAEGNFLRYALASQPAHGTLSGSGASLTYTPAANYHGPDSFTYKVSDGALESNEATVSLTVSAVNDAPTVAITGAPANSSEGTPVTLGGTAEDVEGQGVTLSWTVTRGTAKATKKPAKGGEEKKEEEAAPPAKELPAMKTEAAPTSAEGPAEPAPPSTEVPTETYATGTGASFTFTPDDDGTYVVTVTATDADGTVGNNSASVVVSNVDPTVGAGADGSADEGSAFTSAAAVSDPGAADTHAYTIDYGDGSPEATGNVAGGSVPLSHVYADNGTYTVTVTVTDDDDGTHTDTLEVVVSNVAPAVSAGDDAAVDEGGTFNGSGSFADPGADTWTATVDYGDGTGSQPLALGPGNTFSLGHAYADNGIFTVAVSVKDDDNGAGSDTLLVTVNNVAPTAALSNDGPATYGSPASVSFTGQSDASSADAAAGFRYAYDFTNDGTFDSGDGTYAGSGPGASASLPSNLPAGTHTVRGRILDKDGGFTDYTTSVVINKATSKTLVTFEDGPYVYRGSAFTATAEVTGAGGFSTAVSVVYSGDCANVTVANGCTATATYDGDDNHQGSTDARSITITKAAASIALGDLSQTYSGAPRVATAATNPAGLSGVNVTYDGSAGAPTNAGSYAVVASLDNQNYEAENATGTLVVGKASPAVSAAGNSCTYSGGPCAGSGTATGVDGQDLGPVTLAYAPGGGAPTNAGSYTVVASVAETANHTAGSSAPAAVTIDKAAATVSLTVPPGPVTYDGNPHPAAGFAYGVGGPGDVLSPALSFAYNGGAAEPLDVNTYAVVASFAGNDNYLPAADSSAVITIAQAAALIGVSGYTGTYDGQAHGATGSAKGVKGEDLTALLDLGASFTNAPGGTADWTFTGNTNYAPASGSASIAIGKADAEIDVQGYAGVYDGDAHGATGSARGVQGENLTSLLHLGASFTAVPGGTAHWTFDGDGNYNAAAGNAAVTITQAAATINVSGYTGVYDGQAHGATGTAAGVKGEDLTGLLSLGASFTDAPGGTAHWTFAGDTNYAPAAGDAAITIGKANQAITWTKPDAIVYGTALSAAQLNASVSVVGPAPAGSVSYTPAGGYLLRAGNHQPLTVDFAETNNYNAATKTVYIDVAKATPVVSWNTPAALTYGVSLSGTQLNATAAHPADGGPLGGTAVAGSYAYTPPAGTVLPVGNSNLSVVFTPTNTADYTTATKSVVQRVNYGVCALYDQTKAHKGGSTVPVKLALCDASGKNLSSPGIALTAVGARLLSPVAWGPAEDAGHANPDMNFRFTMFDPATPGYIFNLKTTGMGTGTYELGLTAGGDPTVYTVQFQVK